MKNSLFFFVFVCFFSCDKKKEKSIPLQAIKPLFSIAKKHGVAEKVNSDFLKEIEDWQELKAVDNFLSRFKKASPNEVLSNALELKVLVKSLKDGIKPQLFNTGSFNTRIDILYNETLRLADMTFIPAIKAKKVDEETEKIMNAFSAVNSKVNTVLSKKHFEEAIKIDNNFIGLDSTKIDSISKKSIHKNLRDKLDKIKFTKKFMKPKFNTK